MSVCIYVFLHLCRHSPAVTPSAIPMWYVSSVVLTPCSCLRLLSSCWTLIYITRTLNPTARWRLTTLSATCEVSTSKHANHRISTFYAHICIVTHIYHLMAIFQLNLHKPLALSLLFYIHFYPDRPLLCWCAVKKLLIHSFTHSLKGTVYSCLWSIAVLMMFISVTTCWQLDLHVLTDDRPASWNSSLQGGWSAHARFR